MRAKYLSGVISAVFGMTAAAAGAQTIAIGRSRGFGHIIGLGPCGPWRVCALFRSGRHVFGYGRRRRRWRDLGSTNITVSENFSGELTIWETETGVDIGPTPQQLLFLSSFTQNQVPPGASVTETTWFDASDVAFGTATKLATTTFTAIDTNSPGVNTIVEAPTAYSITEEYDVMLPISTSPEVLSTISLQTTPDGPIPIVPEPSTWIMVAIGFAGLGYAAYGRSRKSRSASSSDRHSPCLFERRPSGGLFCEEADWPAAGGPVLRSGRVGLSLARTRPSRPCLKPT